MPSFTKLALSTLALFAYSADAAPVLAGLGGSGTANGAVVAGAKTDLKVFADAFVRVTTGGKTNTCDSVNLGLVSNLSANLKASLFSKLAVTQCVASYSDVLGCTEFGAYLAVSYYAYISGWAGATLFAALEPARVDRWHSLFDGFCGAHGAPVGVCGGWASEWTNFETLSANVRADIKAAAKLNLQTSGLLVLVDTSAVLKAGVDGVIHIGATATANAKAAVDAAVNTHADVTVDVDVKADVNADIKATADATVDATVDAAAYAAAQADIAAKAALDLKAKVEAEVKAKLDANVKAQLDADVKAKLEAELKAKASAIVHRDLLGLDVIQLVGGLKGEGKGASFLGLTADKLDLGLTGAGKGDAFLGAVVA